MNSIPMTGDLLYRQKGIFGHAGVYLGDMMVFHHSPESGAEVVSLSDYADGKDVHIVKSGSHNRQDLVAALEAILTTDSRYNPFTNNCEHLANTLLFGRHFSGQIQVGLISAAIGGLLSWRAGRGNPAIISVICGIAGCLGTNAHRKYERTIPASHI